MNQGVGCQAKPQADSNFCRETRPIAGVAQARPQPPRLRRVSWALAALLSSPVFDEWGVQKRTSAASVAKKHQGWQVATVEVMVHAVRLPETGNTVQWVVLYFAIDF